jgi:hypothetical protein
MSTSTETLKPRETPVLIRSARALKDRHRDLPHHPDQRQALVGLPIQPRHSAIAGRGVSHCKAMVAVPLAKSVMVNGGEV